jgi:hypothetical protein
MDVQLDNARMLRTISAHADNFLVARFFCIFRFTLYLNQLGDHSMPKQYFSVDVPEMTTVMWENIGLMCGRRGRINRE